MKLCIICRKEKEEFSDEHVIPDSIKGYYHIYTVCKTCNSDLGTKVDSKLVNHKFIEFQRHLLGIKGKSGAIPNPFSGTQTIKDDPEQKVIVTFDDKGQLIPKLLPKIPNITNPDDLANYSFTIDASDLHLKDKIIEKILKRNGIDKSRVNFQEQRERSERPWIQSQMAIDIKDFRIGLLKIAYEFAVDTIEDYFNDPMALLISEVLFKADLLRMEKEITFFGSGLDKEVLKPLSHLIEFENNNHYLVLMQVESIGLICQVNLFNCFSIAIKLSDSSEYLNEGIMIGVNDISKSTFEKLTIDDLVKRTYSPIEYRFQYWLPNEAELFKFAELQNDSAFDFFKLNEQIPFYDKNGNILYENIDIKLKQPQLEHIPKGDVYNDIITQIVLDEELFIKLCPTMDLYQVVSVQIEQHRLTKV
ncbi:HNH endonuclease [Flavobacterium filum]|uniref:HNH endonuclease n=1 Tax=Flavobacterium filum TaxID=370974 RepID=UPI0023F2145B|nr:HNH endonuclease [Flavobacterium filum]